MKFSSLLASQLVLATALAGAATADTAVNKAAQADLAFNKYGATGKGVIVAILDRGARLHPR